MEKTSYVVDGHFGRVQNGPSYVDLQIFYHDQIDFTPGKQVSLFETPIFYLKKSKLKFDSPGFFLVSLKFLR